LKSVVPVGMNTMIFPELFFAVIMSVIVFCRIVHIVLRRLYKVPYRPDKIS